MKKGSGNIIVISIALILFIILVTGLFILKYNKDNQREKSIAGNLISEHQEDTNDKNYSDFLDSNKENMNSSTIQGSESECIEKQISYSMINLNKTSICNHYENEICTDKTVECSIEIHNRDNEVGGFFGVELIFIEEEENIENSLGTKTSRFFLGPMTHNTFKDSINIQGTEEDNLANKNINCLFNTLEVPRKMVCS